MIVRLPACAAPLAAALLFVAASTTTTTTTTTTTMAFTPSPLFQRMMPADAAPLSAVQSPGGKKKGYTPKWTKKQTISEQLGGVQDVGFEKVGLKGTIPVVFQQGNATKTSMAWAGQPIRDVATQAGQFINYGCGKGECGTCECLVNGKWIRPCIAKVPAVISGADGKPEEFRITVKEVKAKSKSSGKFFSIKSFFMGFWNNLLGMIGFVKFRRNARRNWEERQEYEDLIRQKTIEKRRQRLLREQQQREGGQTGPSPATA